MRKMFMILSSMMLCMLLMGCYGSKIHRGMCISEVQEEKSPEKQDDFPV